jgi:hypothetical protein
LPDRILFAAGRIRLAAKVLYRFLSFDRMVRMASSRATSSR